MPVQCTCSTCGATFFRKPARATRIRFCSWECSNVGRRLPLIEQWKAKTLIGPTCWEWTGRKDSHGYGYLNPSGADGRRHGAHRFALEQALGFPLPPEFRALHTCDNPGCVRNDEPGIYVIRGIARPRYGHLWMGTQVDNLADMVDKGRHAVGERHRSKTHPESLRRGESVVGSKTSAADVLEIRRLYAAGGITHEELAHAFGLHRRTIGHIIKKDRWAHV